MNRLPVQQRAGEGHMPDIPDINIYHRVIRVSNIATLTRIAIGIATAQFATPRSLVKSPASQHRPLQIQVEIFRHRFRRRANGIQIKPITRPMPTKPIPICRPALSNRLPSCLIF